MNLINLQQIAHKLYSFKIPILLKVIFRTNSIITKDILLNSIVAGIPAKIIKTNIKMSDYV